MRAWTGPLGGFHVEVPASGRKVTIGDVERQIRSLGGSAQAAVSATKASAGTAAALGVVVVVAVSYLFGRRRGKRRSSVLEIRRV